MRMKTKAFTVLELMIAVGVIGFVVLVFLPAIVPHRRINSVRIRCVNNLKQVGLAFRMWSDDNNNMYPMQYYTNQSGVLLFADATNGFRYFQAMSNELSTPKILVCPADKRTAATNFLADFDNSHLSYVSGLDADPTMPTALLTGDRNLTNGQPLVNGILYLQSNQNIGWTGEMHNGFGNVGVTDGSVQQFTINGLRNFVSHTGLATNRLLFP
jgi:type II secretory pathway pseudopilin PulG